MEPIQIIVTGHPTAKGRARAFVRKDGKPGLVTPKATSWWEEDARLQARVAMKRQGNVPFTGCVEMVLIVYKAVPRSWPKWKKDAAWAGVIGPDGKPDLDNYLKAAKDALNGIVWLDDSQVVGGEQYKTYSERPRVVISVWAAQKLPASTVTKEDLGRIESHEAG